MLSIYKEDNCLDSNPLAYTFPLYKYEQRRRKNQEGRKEGKSEEERKDIRGNFFLTQKLAVDARKPSQSSYFQHAPPSC
jgi:hypothetical protein